LFVTSCTINRTKKLWCVSKIHPLNCDLMREDAQRSATSLPFTLLRERNHSISAMA